MSSIKLLLATRRIKFGINKWNNHSFRCINSQCKCTCVNCCNNENGTLSPSHSLKSILKENEDLKKDLKLLRENGKTIFYRKYL